jgi:hypothetical protein
MNLITYNQLVCQYIRHSQIIAENSPRYFDNPSFARAMQKCQSLLLWLEAYRKKATTETTCKQISRYSNYLWGILPNPRNNSYRSSLKRLMLIISAAEKQLKDELPTQTVKSLF